MEELKHLCRAHFDQVIRGENDLILFFYRKEDPSSILGLNAMNDVFSFIAKPFDMYLIDIDAEPDITAAFSVKNVPEYISVKNQKIYKRSTELLEPSEILSMLK